MTISTTRTILLAAAALSLGSAPLLAQDWPNGPVTIIVPYDAGGTTDNMVRALATEMEQVLGQSVVISNMAGGGGVVGMSAALQSAPDGQTVGLYLTNTLVGMAIGSAPFEADSIMPACMFGETPLTITGKGGADGLASLEDLLAMPDASLAIERGTLSEFAGLMINGMTPNDINLVNAGTGPEKNAAVMGGHITALITPTAGVIQQHEAGQLNIVAVLADERMEIAPDLPTAKEQGLDVSLSQSNGFMFPAGTPEPVVAAFCDALETATSAQGVQDQLAALNVQVNFMRGDEFSTYMTDTSAQITALAQDAGYAD
jgi:tripartite-type tricarboxylate transporter receptor subunit TctC